MTVTFVVLGAVIGAPLRYLIDLAVQRRVRSPFPWGTLTVNAIACAGLGLVTGAVSTGVASPDLQALLGTGLLATLSTYSTFSFQTFRLIEDRESWLAAANVVVSIVVGLAAAALTREAAQAFWG